jgi:hypothetical protein
MYRLTHSTLIMPELFCPITPIWASIPVSPGLPGGPGPLVPGDLPPGGQPEIPAPRDPEIPTGPGPDLPSPEPYTPSPLTS